MKRLAASLLAVLLALPCHLRAEAPPLAACKLTTNVFKNENAIAIPEGSSNLITSTITVKGAKPYLWDLDLRTFITHPENGELSFTLKSPKGTVVTISTNNATGFGNVFDGVLFDDQANPLGKAPYTSNNGMVTDHSYTNNITPGSLTPEEPLGAFRGENPNGDWVLTILDASINGKAGALNSWELDVVTIPNAGATFSSSTLLANNNPLAITDNSTISSTINVNSFQSTACQISMNLNITHTFNRDLLITLTSPSGRSVTVTSRNGGARDDVFAGVFLTDSKDPGSQIPYTENPNIVTDHIYAEGSAPDMSPEEPFSAFIGESLPGTWTLTITDQGQGDIGTLNSWTLNYVACSNPSSDVDFDGAKDICDDCDADILKDSPGACGCGVSDVDTDGDGVANCNDQCASDSQKTVPGICGCGIPDTDSDGDGTANCNEACVQDPQKTTAGACGCGTADTDSDGDGSPDCVDACPADLLKTAPGKCGCRMVDSDTNSNGITDCFVNQELKSQLTKLQNAVKKLKPALAGKKRAAAVKTVKTEIAATQSFVGANQAEISTSSNVQKLLQDVVKKSKKALKLGKTEKKKALKAISAFSKAL